MNNYVKSFFDQVSLKGKVDQVLFTKSSLNSSKDDVMKARFMSNGDLLHGMIYIVPDDELNADEVKVYNLLNQHDDEQFGLGDPHQLTKMINLFTEDVNDWEVGFELDESLFDGGGEIISLLLKDNKYNCNYPLVHPRVLKKVSDRAIIDFPITTNLTKEVIDDINKSNQVIHTEDFIVIPGEHSDKVTLLWSDTNSKNRRSQTLTLDVKLDTCREKLKNEGKFSSDLLKSVLSVNNGHDKCTLNLIDGLVNLVFEKRFLVEEPVNEDDDGKYVTIVSDYTLISKR